MIIATPHTLSILKHSTYIYRNTLIRCLSNSRTLLCANAEKAQENASESAPPKSSEQLLQDIIKLTDENVNLSSQISDLQDKYRRTLADRENVRNRLEKQILEARQFGIQGFCKDLLEVTDVFSKAIESVPPEDVKEAGSSLKNLYDGLVMTESTLIGVLRRHKLLKIEPNIGEKFNPTEQEAMFEVPASEQSIPGTVAHILRPGWSLHGRCIRSSQVGVVKD